MASPTRFDEAYEEISDLPEKRGSDFGIVDKEPESHPAESVVEEEEDSIAPKPIFYPEHYIYHLGKKGQIKTKVPIDLDDGWNDEPGCGGGDDSFARKCLSFWSIKCYCDSKNKFEISLKRVFARIFMGALLWGYFWSITDLTDIYYTALPGGNLFGIIMVFLFGIIGETLIVLIPLPFDLPSLPPLLASLLVGIILRNVNAINWAAAIKPNWSFTLRQMALGIILGEAGVEVDKQQMYLLRWVVPRLSFLPCLSESFTWGITAHWIMQLPWEWSFMLGFVCGAVAPACVVPSMIRFQAKGMGVLHGVPTLCMSAASIDDIIAINGFNIVLTITFSDGGVGFDLLIAVVEITLGIILGLIAGYLMWVFPDGRQHNVVRDRAYLLVFTSWVLIFSTNDINLGGAGTLGTLTCSFVGSMGWPEEQVHGVGVIYKSMWYVFQPLLFGLTGANVELDLLTGETVARATINLCIALSVRLTVAGSSVSFLGWAYREKFLTAVAWIPKATVQAAIGGAALDKVNSVCYDGRVFIPKCTNGTTEGTLVIPSNTTGSGMTTEMMNLTTIMTTTTQTTTPDMMMTTNNQTVVMQTTQPSCLDNPPWPDEQDCADMYGWATIILQVSVLVILYTAPIGVFLIGVFGPILLRVDDPNMTGGQIKDAEKGEGDTSSIRSSDGPNGFHQNKAYQSYADFSLSDETSAPPYASSETSSDPPIAQTRL